MFRGPLGGHHGAAATVSENYPHSHANAVTCAFYTVALTPLTAGQVRQRLRRGESLLVRASGTAILLSQSPSLGLAVNRRVRLVPERM